MKYWINHDNWDTLHTENCKHVRNWARPPKWQCFETEEEARNAIAESRLRECEDCLGN